MAELLETTMRVCFGFSWPLSVMKNIKSGTAKSMSLPFILLIITGYVAGICAKLLSGKINHVLAVYLANFIFVSVNLAVFFINRRHDKKAAQKAESVLVKKRTPDPSEKCPDSNEKTERLAEEAASD